MSVIFQAFQDAYKPIPKQTIWEWAAKTIKLDPTSAIPGYYKIENSPQLREPLDCFQSEAVREQVTIGPNQGGRTKGMEIAMLWTIRNRPGPTQWNTDTNSQAVDFAEERFWPVADQVKEIKEVYPTDKDKKRLRKILFSTGYPLVMQGANLTNSQQKAVLNQFNDEVFKWAEGMLNNFHKRTTSYEATRKIWDASVAGNEGEQLSQRWDESSQGEWCFECPVCGYVQPFQFGGIGENGGLKWETNQTTRPNGEWDYTELAKTVRYQCALRGCSHYFPDKWISRKAMNESAVYVHRFPLRKIRGHRFNALSVNWPGLSWAKWIEEFLKAKHHWKQFGNLEPLRLYWTRRMAQFWEEGKYTGGDKITVKNDYTLGHPNIWLKEKWGEEWGRFLSADKQDYGYPSVIRAVKAGGESRLVWTGVLSSYDEIQLMAEKYGVCEKAGTNKAARILIDCSYEMRDVFGQAAKRGWTCFRGSDRENFLHIVKEKVPDSGEEIVRKVLRPYAQMQWGDPGLGTTRRPGESQRGVRYIQPAFRPGLARVIEWSNLSIKNMLYALKRGTALLYYGIPADVPGDYLEEMNGDRRYTILDRKGRATYFWSNAGRNGRSQKKPNHRWDAECQILCAMIMQQLIDLDSWQTEKPMPSEAELATFNKSSGKSEGNLDLG